MMPDVTGMDFYAQLEQLDKTQASAVIVLTGGAFTAQARQFLEEVENDRLDSRSTFTFCDRWSTVGSEERSANERAWRGFSRHSPASSRETTVTAGTATRDFL